jgi:hypothetical protein
MKAKEEIVHKTSECQFCAHHYLQPCKDKAAAAKCPNTKVKNGKV